jgi:hypothetical protein
VFDKPREETKLNLENCENCIAHNLKEKPDCFEDYFPLLQFQELVAANLHESSNHMQEPHLGVEYNLEASSPDCNFALMEMLSNLEGVDNL